MTDTYRYETGSLYEYDAKRDAYVHVWCNAYDDTEEKAIKAYEEFLMLGEAE